MTRQTLILLTVLLALLMRPANAQTTDTKNPEPITTQKPDIDIATLRIKLKPLTKTELVTEFEGWRKLLKAKVTEVGEAHILARGESGSARKTALARLSQLEQQRAGLIARCRATTKALSAKGGDIAEYNKYIAAVSNTDVALGDAAGLWTMLVNWAQSPTGGWLWLRNIVLFLVTLAAFRILARILGRITRRTVDKLDTASTLLKDFFVNAVRKVTFVIGLVAALSFLGIEVGPFLAAFGAVGFILGFALQGTLSNFAAGIMILMYRPFDVGNFVKVSDTSGTVEAMSLVSTTLRTPDNQKVIVPNNSIWGNIITNITGTPTRRVDMTFGIGYSDDIDKAIVEIQAVLDANEKILDDPKSVIRVHALADSSVNLIVRPWTKTSDYWDVFWDVTKSVKQRFDAADITIPFPQRDVHLIQAPAS